MEARVYWMLGHSFDRDRRRSKGTWWPRREERLVRRLTADGYPVVFAQVGAEDVLERVPGPSS